MLRHSIHIDTYEFAKAEKVTIRASASHYYSSRQEREERTIVAIGTVLQVMLGLKEQTDFTMESGYEQNKVIVNGKCNMLFALNMLLTHSDTFSMSNRDEILLYHFIPLLISTIDDSTITPVERDKLKPLVFAYLDAAYQQIKGEEVVKAALTANPAEQIDETNKDDILNSTLAI